MDSIRFQGTFDIDRLKLVRGTRVQGCRERTVGDVVQDRVNEITRDGRAKIAQIKKDRFPFNFRYGCDDSGKRDTLEFKHQKQGWREALEIKRGSDEAIADFIQRGMNDAEERIGQNPRVRTIRIPYDG